jgi:hypothetical protein
VTDRAWRHNHIGIFSAQNVVGHESANSWNRTRVFASTSTTVIMWHPQSPLATRASKNSHLKLKLTYHSDSIYIIDSSLSQTVALWSVENSFLALNYVHYHCYSHENAKSRHWDIHFAYDMWIHKRFRKCIILAKINRRVRFWLCFPWLSYCLNKIFVISTVTKWIRCRISWWILW